jgi:hypothetical protein
LQPGRSPGKECYNAVLYLAGGTVFIAGSILFFPALAP